MLRLVVWSITLLAVLGLAALVGVVELLQALLQLGVGVEGVVLRRPAFEADLQQHRHAQCRRLGEELARRHRGVHVAAADVVDGALLGLVLQAAEAHAGVAARGRDVGHVGQLHVEAGGGGLAGLLLELEHPQLIGPQRTATCWRRRRCVGFRMPIITPCTADKSGLPTTVMVAPLAQHPR